jgi:hypothetical protein
MTWLTKEKIIKLVWLWMGINFVMSLTSNLHVSYYYSLPYLDSLGQTIVRVYCISSLAALFGTWSGHRFCEVKKPWVFLLVVFFSVCGALLGMALSDFLVNTFFSPRQIQIGEQVTPYTFTSAILSATVISIIATVISILIENNYLYKNQLEKVQHGIDKEFFIYKNRDQRGKINLGEIIYLTADGKHTILHTSREDIDLPMLLKEAANQLSPKTFLRTHKKHFVNTTYIESLKYIRAGVYELYLNDIEESIVPVGRKYLSEIQSFFKDIPVNRKIALNHGLNEKQA